MYKDILKMVLSKMFKEGSFYSAATDVLSALDNIGYKVGLTHKVIKSNSIGQVISSSSHVTGPKQYSSKDFIWTLHKQSRYDIDI